MNQNTVNNGMLDDAALEDVAGGTAFIQSFNFYGEVPPEKCVVGQTYYFVSKFAWAQGQVVEITRSGINDCHYKVHITTKNGFDADMTLTIAASQIKLYTNMTADC